MPFYTQSHGRRHHRKRHESTREMVMKMKAKLPDAAPKFFDTNGTYNPTNVGTIIQLDAMTVLGAGGNAENSRIGYVIKQSSSYVNYTLSALASTNPFVRIIHFIWKSESSPSISLILEQSTAGTVSPLNREYAKNIRVIKDRLYALGQGETAFIVEKWYKKMFAQTTFVVGGALTTTTHNGYYCLILSDQGAGTAPILNYYHRLNFKDA